MELTEENMLYLLSNFTHQVINPLNGVIGTLDNIIDGTVEESKIPTRLNSARGQLESTVSLIRNLAFFAQYTADYTIERADKAEKTCIIPQLAIEAAQFFQEPARSKEISIEILDRWKQFAVRGNSDLIRQVFMNIIDNGVKYGLHSSPIRFQFWIQKRTSDLIVKITGKSIGFLSNEPLFDVGFRGKSAIDETSSGTGLGLHICKLIVENVFDGKIDAEHSNASKETTFQIKLPNGFDLKSR